ncbi:hypothetical protein B0G93_11872 [Bacillus sp. V-88]|mgnify:CR=1 FL=1|jgi:hypothetical protein|nr:hypothetical protein B0G93_11872 [Bacillus sp. V-88]SLK24029.1 hypothetical protein SAMN06295884_11872 [Bacillus sp. V-88]
MRDIIKNHPFLKYSFYVIFGFLSLSFGYILGKWVIENSL